MNEKVKAFLEIVDLPTKSHLLNIDDKQTLAEYRILRTQVEDIFNNYEESKKELIAEQHRLFDLAKEQETELNELKEFVKVLCKMKIVDSNHKIYGINETDIELIKKVVEKYGNKED